MEKAELDLINLADPQATFDAMVAKKDDLEKQVENTTLKLERAEQLIGGLVRHSQILNFQHSVPFVSKWLASKI